MALGVWNPHQYVAPRPWVPRALPLTTQLPYGAGVANAGLPWQMPTNVVQAAQLPMGAGMGTTAGDLSSLYTQAPMNPANSRAIASEWGGGRLANLQAPMQPAPQFAPVQSMATPPGITNPNVAGLYENVYAGNPAPPAMPDLPAPPSNVGTALAGEAEALGAKTGGKFSLSSLAPSYLPESLASKMSPKLAGGLNMAGGVATYAGMNLLNQAARNNNWLGGSATPAGRELQQGLSAGQVGAMISPQMAVGNVLFGGAMQRGMDQTRNGTPMANSLAGALAQNVFGQNSAVGKAVGVADQAALESIPGIGTAYKVGEGLGFLPKDLGSSVSEVRNNVVEKVPVVGGWLSDLMGGTDGSKKAEEEGGGEAEAPTVPDYARDPALAQQMLGDTMTQIGLTADVQAAVMDQFNTDMVMNQANRTRTPTTEQEKADLEAAGLKPDKSGAYTMSDEMIRQGAYQNAMNMIPGLKQQQASERDSTRRAAALQAAIVNQIPAATQPFYDAAHAGYDTLGQAMSGMPAGMQAAGQSYIDNMRTQTGRLGDAWATGLASIPQYMAMESQASQAASIRNQIQSQVQQAQIMQALQAQMPGLFPSSSSSSSGLGISPEDLQAALGSK